MKRTWLKVMALVLVLAMGLMVFSGCQPTQSEDKELVILTWQDYVPDSVIKQFEEKTGIKVVYNYFADSDEMLTKVQATGGSEYDIIIASDYAIDILRKQDMLLKLDKSKIPNYDNLDPNYLSEFYDPENEYTVPYGPGTPLIIYDPEKIDFEITGYNSLWDPRLEDSVVTLDYARVMVGFVLKSMGYSLNETDPELLALAEEKLMTLAPNIRVLDADNPHLVMLAGDASIGLMYGSQVAWAYGENPNLKVVYPIEGMGFGIDCVFAPKAAPHPGAVHEFMNFICDGQISAEISMDENIMAISCNKAAVPYLSEEYKANPVLYIPSEYMVGREFIEDIGEVAESYSDIWSRFKQAID